MNDETPDKTIGWKALKATYRPDGTPWKPAHELIAEARDARAERKKNPQAWIDKLDATDNSPSR